MSLYQTTFGVRPVLLDPSDGYLSPPLPPPPPHHHHHLPSPPPPHTVVVLGAMGVLMGVRTATPLEFADDASRPRAELFEALKTIDPEAAAAAAAPEGSGVTPLRYLRCLDELSSTSSLGFRIDACRTLVGATQVGHRADGGRLEELPLSGGKTLATLREEADIEEAFCTFFQRDGQLAEAALTKLQAVIAALKRSPFFAQHVFLRSQLLIVYDDEARTSSLDLKLLNFAFSYELKGAKDGAAVPKELTHTEPWDGTVHSHEDGYMTGMLNLERVLQAVCAKLPAASFKLSPVGS